MLPECLWSTVSQAYVPDKSELILFEALSLFQITAYFKEEVAFFQAESPVFSKIKQQEYYVLFGDKDSDTEIISGSSLSSFSVELPAYSDLFNAVAQTVPRADISAFSVELESLFDHEVKVAQVKVWEYATKLQHIHELGCLTREAVLSLIHKIYEKKVFSGWKAIITQEKISKQTYILESLGYDKQLAALSEVLQLKGS